MKKIIYTLFVLVGFASMSFAQTSDVADTKGKTELTSSKSSGVYEFTLPSGLEEETVNKNASYYKAMFTVDYNASSNQAKVSMVTNEAKNRFVIGRFLSACGVKEVKVDSDNLALHEFMDAYLK